MKHADSSFPPQDRKKPRGSRFARCYTRSALIILNTLVFLIVVNLLLGVAFWAYDRHRFGGKDRSSQPRANAFFYQDGSPIDNGKRTRYQLDVFDFTACQGISPEEAAAVLDDFFEFAQTSFIYQPWVQFSDVPFRSKHLNVLPDEADFPRRRTENPANPNQLPEIVVWAMGGSTTFGYHVADRHTWPSCLSQMLNERARQENLGVHIRVENYGRAAYTPSQEVILLWDLLRSGQRPSLVVFMDGINMGGPEDYPDRTPELSKMFQIVQQERVYYWLWAERLRVIPLGRLAAFLQKNLWARPSLSAPVITEDQEVRWICNRFRENWWLAGELSRHVGANLLVCLQPTPFYHYDMDLTPIPINDISQARKRLTEGLYTTLRSKSDCLYLGDLYVEWGHRRKIYLSDAHYTPAFSKFLAERLASHIDLRKLVVSPGYLPQEATGAPRRRPAWNPLKGGKG